MNELAGSLGWGRGYHGFKGKRRLRNRFCCVRVGASVQACQIKVNNIFQSNVMFVERGHLLRGSQDKFISHFV